MIRGVATLELLLDNSDDHVLSSWITNVFAACAFRRILAEILCSSLILRMGEKQMTKHVTETSLVAANDIDAALELSLTTVWDAKVYSWDNSKYPFNEWILERIRGMGYKLNDLSYLHESIPLSEVYTVTKQLCADTNLPEFRRMLNRFVREVVVTQGKLRLPVAVQRFMNVRIMLPTTPNLFYPYHTGLLYGHGVASRSMWLPFVDVTADEDRTGPCRSSASRGRVS